MPIILNGKFWSIKDIADKIGMPYNSLAQKISEREGVIWVGKTALIPDELAKLIIHDLNYQEIRNSIAISALAKELTIQVPSLRKIISYGIPIIKNKNQHRIANKYVPFLKRAVDEIIAREVIFPFECAGEAYQRMLELMEQSKK